MIVPRQGTTAFAPIIQESIAARFHWVRLLVSLGATVVLIGAWLVRGDGALAIVGAVSGVVATHAAVALRRRTPPDLTALLVDLSVTLVAVALLRPPAGSLPGPIMYLTLSAVLFTSRKSAPWIAAIAAAGGSSALVAGHLIAPKQWSDESVLMITAASITASVFAVSWLLRRVAEGLSERDRLATMYEEKARDFALVLETVAEGIIGVNTECMGTFANRAVKDILGYEPDALIGEIVHDKVHYLRPDGSSHAVDECAMHPVNMSPMGLSSTDCMVASDGAMIPVSVSARRLIDRGGGGVVVSFHSIAGELEAQRVVQFQASLIDQMGSAVVVAGLDGRIQFWNRQASALYRRSADEAVGMLVAETILADADENAFSEVSGLVAARGWWQGELTMRKGDGSTFPALITSTLIHDAGGRAAGIANVSVDVSDLHRITEEVERRGVVARGVLDSVEFPVAVVAHDGEVTAVNHAWRRFGEENGGGATAGVGANYLAVTHASDGGDGAREAANGLAAVLEGRLDTFDLEYPCHGPDEERWFRMSVTPLQGIGAVVVHWDTTVDRQARNALNELVTAKDRFIAVLAHEIRTPLTSILGFAEELQGATFTGEEAAELQSLIATQAHELSYLVDDLLVATRLDLRSIRIRAGHCRLIEEVDSLVTSMPPDVCSLIEIDRESLGHDVIADGLRLRQVLRNLMSNAAYHGGVPIRISAQEGGRMVVISVIDHGPGVPDEIADTLFEPYVSVSVQGSAHDSVGLGLFVSRQLALLMGGDLTYNRSDGCSVFSLSLPQAD